MKRIQLFTLILMIIGCFSLKAQNVAREIRIQIETSMAISQNVKTFYINRDFKPFWIAKNLASFMDVVEDAQFDGLTPLDYNLEGLLKSKSVQKSDIEQAKFEFIVMASFMKFTKHLSVGKVAPSLIDPNWKVDMKDYDEIRMLKELNSTESIQGFIEGKRSAIPGYSALRSELKKLKEFPYSQANIIVPIKSIEVGDSSKIVVEIRKRLEVLGGLKEVNNSNVYTEKLKDKILEFQKNYGLIQDGKIGKGTIEELNKSSAERVDQIRVNLERMRWLPQRLNTDRIMINAARFTLQKFENDKLNYSAKVIVGKLGRQTPVFHATMSYLVLNPTWTVPPGILRNDIIPASLKNSGYVSTKNIQIFNSEGKIIKPETIDWAGSEPYKYTFRQPAGKENALGAVKFMFPNPHSIYIHDTPSKELFKSEERAFSSGCIRLENPLVFAEALLSDQPIWTNDKIIKVIGAGETTTVRLSKPIEVYLYYFTAFQHEEGQVRFAKDIYSRDKKILNLL